MSEATRRQALFAALGALGAAGLGHAASPKPARKAPDLGKQHLRVARGTDNLEAVIAFYRDGLGLALLFTCKGHTDHGCVMLGSKDGAYHLEFTWKTGHKFGRAPTEENLLVFYLPDVEEWNLAVARLEKHGHKPVKAFNPYWDRKGKTFEDPDGYRVVLQNAAWAL
jgi:catechol 2,3-dioxygenase-like lactoylglutathione lyase family enzyme